MRIQQITSPIEPVSLQEVKDHLRIDSTDEDIYLTDLISASRAAAEDYADIYIAKRQLKLFFDDFSAVKLVNPVISVDEVAYYDTEGASQTVANYFVNVDRVFCSELLPAYNESWPEVEEGYEKVEITLTVGFVYLPENIRQAIKMICATLHQSREDNVVGTTTYTVPMSSQRLLSKYRAYSV